MEQPVGFYTKVIIGITSYCQTRTAETDTLLTGANGFERVFEGDGIKNSFEIMVTIFPLADDIESEVDFAVGKKNLGGLELKLKIEN